MISWWTKVGNCQWFSMGYFTPLWINARPSGRVMVSLSWNLCVQRKIKGSMTRRRARMPTLIRTTSYEQQGLSHTLSPRWARKESFQIFLILIYSHLIFPQFFILFLNLVLLSGQAAHMGKTLATALMTNENNLQSTRPLTL